MIVSFTFAAYIVFVALISWWAYRRTHASEDYFLGGRQLSPGTAALSAGASDMSGWLLLGLPGYAFASGFESIWLSGGLCLGLAVCWLTVARRLRVYSEFLDNALTIPAYLQRRFHDRTPALRLTTAFFILLFFLFYVSSGFVAGAKLFATIFDTAYVTGVVLTFIFVVVYTLIGGFLAVSWTDVLQGLLMLLALMVAPVMVIVANGGMGASLGQVDSHLLNPLTTSDGEPLGWLAIVSLTGWGLGYFGQPHILARFKALRRAEEVKNAATIAIGWSLLVNIFAIGVGLCAVVYFSGTTLDDPETVFMVLANTLYHPVIAGTLMAAILAAIMSTADSQLLVCSSAIAEDFLGVIRKTEHNVDALNWGRAGVGVIGVLAMLFALDPESGVLDIVSYAWAGLGAAFGPVILISLYSPRMSRAAALAGIVTGGLTVVVWKQLSGGVFDLYELVPGFAFSAIAVVLISAIQKQPEATLAESFAEFERRLP